MNRNRIQLNRFWPLNIWICCVLWWFWIFFSFVFWTVMMSIQLHTEIKIIIKLFIYVWYMWEVATLHIPTRLARQKNKPLKQRNQTEEQKKTNSFSVYFFLRGAVTSSALTVVFFYFYLISIMTTFFFRFAFSNFPDVVYYMPPRCFYISKQKKKKIRIENVFVVALHGASLCFISWINVADEFFIFVLFTLVLYHWFSYKTQARESHTRLIEHWWKKRKINDNEFKRSARFHINFNVIEWVHF